MYRWLKLDWRCICLPLAGLALATAAPPPVRPLRADRPFWIGTDTNQVFSRQTLEFIAPRAAFFILRGHEQGPTPDYDYVAIMQRLKTVRPDLPRLVYGTFTTLMDTSRIEKPVLRGYEGLGPMLLRDAHGEILRHGANVFGDPTLPAYRDCISERFAAAVERYRADGIALDLTSRMPHFLGEAFREKNPTAYAAYGNGVDQTLVGIKRALNPKLVIYNGLWNSVKGVPLFEQRKLLAFADGAAVEYFGLDPMRDRDQTGSSFATDILPYLEIVRAHPEKTFLLYGRGPWHYTDYEADYFWQRYLFASYLLVAGPNVSFKYHAIFQSQRGSGRTGGLDVFADSDLDFGAPLGFYEKRGALYRRLFVRGLVLVAPHEGTGGVYELTHPMYDPEGRRYAGSVQVPPGNGLLLFHTPPPGPAVFAENFENASAGIRELPWSAVRVDETGNHYLHLEPTPGGRTSEHDLILDWVRTPHAPSRLHLRVRTTDRSARLLAVTEIDDPGNKYTDAIVQLGPDTADATRIAFAPRVSFRLDTRPHDPSEGRTPLLNAGTALRATGAWQEVTLEFPTVAGRYVFRRWDFLRSLGRLDLDDLRLE